MDISKTIDSMKEAIEETDRRRAIQQAYNEEHGITPQTIRKSVRDLISISKKIAAEELNFERDPEAMDKAELKKLIDQVEKKMQKRCFRKGISGRSVSSRTFHF